MPFLLHQISLKELGSIVYIQKHFFSIYSQNLLVICFITTNLLLVTQNLSNHKKIRVVHIMQKQSYTKMWLCVGVQVSALLFQRNQKKKMSPYTSLIIFFCFMFMQKNMLTSLYFYFLFFKYVCEGSIDNQLTSREALDVMNIYYESGISKKFNLHPY